MKDPLSVDSHEIEVEIQDPRSFRSCKMFLDNAPETWKNFTLVPHAFHVWVSFMFLIFHVNFFKFRRVNEIILIS